MDIYTKKFNINFSDVGENNELTNKGILRLMQEISGIHSASFGYGVNDTPKTGLAWVILNWKLKVFSRPIWNTEITLKTWAKWEKHIYSCRDIEMYDDKNNLIAIATSKWILFDINKKSISRITPEIKELFPNVSKSVFEEEFTSKLEEPENSSFVTEYTIQRRDIDTNHHVNNLIYLDYAYEALPQNVFSSMNFSNVEIMYKRESKLGDTLSIFYSHTENDEYIITIKDKNQKTIHTIIKLYN